MINEEGAGRPSTSTTDEKIQQAREMVLANQRVAIDEVVMALPIKSSMTSSASINSVRDGCQESLPQRTSANMLRSANAYSTATTMKAKNI